MNVTVRIVQDRLFKVGVALLSFLALLPLFLILYYITRNGISSVNWRFLVNLPRPVGESGGGIANAVVGTAILLVLSSVVAIPLGIAAGIFLAEHRRGRITYMVRLAVEVLQGIPSIVIGIIAYAWIVLRMGKFSALSGGVALGIMMLPVVIRATEETLKMIPDSLREASLALGVPYHRTILRVILPAGLGGIMTGVLVSVARVAGETAPLLFTAFGSPYMALNILKPVSSLPLMIFNYATSPYPEWHSLAWGASFVLAVFVLGLNLVAKVVTRKWKVQF
ncbi:MAG TPA: phosphate ABC transporter permease PstA [bacterium]|nr:phosphate ABC transporter permease PstA [bacterium]